VHLVGFIIRIYHDARSLERQNLMMCYELRALCSSGFVTCTQHRLILMPSIYGTLCDFTIEELSVLGEKIHLFRTGSETVKHSLHCDVLIYGTYVYWTVHHCNS